MERKQNVHLRKKTIGNAGFRHLGFVYSNIGLEREDPV